MENLGKHLKSAFTLIFVIWAVHLVNLLFGGFLMGWGIVPRTVKGLVGIFTCPFIHSLQPSPFQHIISNTVPLFLLVLILLVWYEKIAGEAIAVIILLGGFLVWLFGRSSSHIGASGLIYGLAAFLVAAGIFFRNLRSILLAIVVALIYGGLIYGVLPLRAEVSWESHAFSAVAGVVAAWGLGKRQRQPG